MNDLEGQQEALVRPRSTFNVAVVATMSSGKSTLLNAMLGTPLLPVSNRACTATVFKLCDVDGMKDFRFRARGSDGEWSDWQLVDQGSLDRHNCSDFPEVEVHGDFPHIDNHRKGHAISFYDTPGPNNSGNTDHEAVTKRILESADYNAIICVLHAGQHRVYDERVLLEFLRKCLDARPQGCDVCFALNQFDRLDPDNGEDPLETVKGTTAYLDDLGFSDPVVIPTMGRLSLQMRRCFQSLDSQGCSSLPERSLKNLALDVSLMQHFYERYKQTLLGGGAFDYFWQRATDQHRPYRDIPAAKLIGKKVAMETLIKCEIATGVPILEEYLEAKLLQHVRAREESASLVEADTHRQQLMLVLKTHKQQLMLTRDTHRQQLMLALDTHRQQLMLEEGTPPPGINYEPRAHIRSALALGKRL